MSHIAKYIWRHSTWPNFRWDHSALLKPWGDGRFRQGKLLAQMNALGLDARQQARAEVLVQEALKTSEIEGEQLDPSAVRSSLALRL